MTTTIEVNALRVYAHHGVMPQERAVGNEFEVTVHVKYPEPLLLLWIVQLQQLLLLHSC